MGTSPVRASQGRFSTSSRFDAVFVTLFFSGSSTVPFSFGQAFLLWIVLSRPTTSAYFLERALACDGADEFFKIPKTLSKNAVFLQTFRQSQHGQLHQLWALLAGQHRGSCASCTHQDFDCKCQLPRSSSESKVRTTHPEKSADCKC